MSPDKIKGKCEGCGKTPRVLTRIESGQQVCRTCLREIRGPKIEYVCSEAVESLRRKGFDVPDKLSREEYGRLRDQHLRAWQTQEIRAAGMAVADDASFDDLGRLWRIARLRSKGVEIPDSSTIEEIILRESLRVYANRVVGVSKANRNGTSRQEIISRCRQWEEVRFRPEPDNPVDDFAIAVCRANGEQLGYLNSGLAEIVSDCIKRGWRYFPIIKQILSDGIASHDRGVVLLVIAAGPNVATDVVRKFARDALARARADQAAWDRQRKGLGPGRS